jgi:hypothetical protein
MKKLMLCLMRRGRIEHIELILTMPSINDYPCFRIIFYLSRVVSGTEQKNSISPLG